MPALPVPEKRPDVEPSKPVPLDVSNPAKAALLAFNPSMPP
jgi:hypothetical protein